jgi:transcription elongation factor GreA
MNETVITREGRERLGEELERLTTEGRRAVAERLRVAAASEANAAENADYLGAREEQAQLERRIALLEAQLAVAEIVAPVADGRAGIGSVVRVRDGDGSTFEYELVGPLESDASNGCVSIGAPVGQALRGQRAGALVEVTTPRGPLTLEVVSVRPRRAVPKEAA